VSASRASSEFTEASLLAPRANNGLSLSLCLVGFRYWNDPEALHKFGRAMGVGPSSEAAGAEQAEAEEEAGEEGEYEEESIIHHTASVGDVEVSHLTLHCTALCYLDHR
jgi:hypothetical protein